LIIDGKWSVLGSTNFDNRSFVLNDEVNVALLDPALSRVLQADFATDISQSRAVSLDEWRRRPLLERALAAIGRLIERQQCEAPGALTAEAAARGEARGVAQR